MKRFIVILLLAAICFTSCHRVLWVVLVKGRTGLKEMAKFENPENGRKITFIGMSHVETVRYYEEIKNYLDSLRRNGYVVVFESILPSAPNEPIDTAAFMTAARKYRRLTNGAFSARGYSGFEGISKNKGDRPGQLVEQTMERVGLSYEKDEWCDLTVQEVIDRYESEYGEIVLTECDLNTSFESKYKCRTTQKFSRFHADNTLRNEHILKKVVESKHQKIVMVYGRMHMFFLKPDLEEHGFVCTDWLVSEAKKKKK